MRARAAAGKTRKFSEQQVMDCSWRDGNEACDGGDYDTAIDYLVTVRPARPGGPACGAAAREAAPAGISGMNATVQGSLCGVVPS